MTPTVSPAGFARAFAALVVGLIVGAVGTVTHRAEQPWGLIGALALVLAASVMMRAWGGWPAIVGIAGGVFFSVQVLAQTGPGGDVLVPGDQPIGWIWVIGALVMVGLASIAPRAWFDDTPRPARNAAAAPQEPAAAPPAEEADEHPAAPDAEARATAEPPLDPR